MKKMSQKNNKGFSLVELIVVVAIMAVLMGILVPTLVKNVEKSKKQKDTSAVEEIRTTMVTNLADPLYSDLEATIIYNGTDSNSNKITITTPDDPPAPTTDLGKFLAAVSSDVKDWTFTSKDYKAKPKVTFVIKDQMVTTYSDALGESAPADGTPATQNPTT